MLKHVPRFSASVFKSLFRQKNTLYMSSKKKKLNSTKRKKKNKQTKNKQLFRVNWCIKHTLRTLLLLLEAISNQFRVVPFEFIRWKRIRKKKNTAVILQQAVALLTIEKGRERTKQNNNKKEADFSKEMERIHIAL